MHFQNAVSLFFSIGKKSNFKLNNKIYICKNLSECSVKRDIQERLAQLWSRQLKGNNRRYETMGQNHVAFIQSPRLNICVVELQLFLMPLPLKCLISFSLIFKGFFLFQRLLIFFFGSIQQSSKWEIWIDSENGLRNGDSQ